jgi:tetratricopeptide (TPR) repeat protein
VSQEKKPIAPVLFLIAFCVLTLYSQKLSNGFVFDDYAFIIGVTEQTDIRNIPTFFTTDQSRLYRPMRSVAYTLVYALFGYSVIAHHLVGIFLHTGITLLFSLIVFRLSGSRRLALLAGLFAGLHPIHCDRAVNMTGSFDLLGTFFGYAALLPALRYMRRGKPVFLLATILLLGVGLFSSEEAATALFFMILLFLADTDARKKPARGTLLFGISGAAVAFYLLLRSAIIPGFSRVEQYAAGGIVETLMTMSIAFWRYIGLTLAPFGLSVEHATVMYKQVSLVPVLALLGLVALAIVAFVVRKNQPLIFVAIGWFFIGLAPFSNLIPLQTLFAERYFYSGLFGVGLALAIGADKGFAYFKGGAKVAFSIAMVAYGVSLFALSTERIHVWHDAKSLWSDAISKEPNTYLGNLNWGNELSNLGETEKALAHWKRAAQIKPTGHEVWIAFGNVEMTQGSPAQAKMFYQKALDARPGHIPAREGLMQAHLKLGNTNEAYRFGVELLKTDPKNLVSLNVVGYILAYSGHCREAVPVLKSLRDNANKDLQRSAAQTGLEFCQTKAKAETP